jgi:hypothetical protein
MNKKVYNLYDFRSNQIANFPVIKSCDNEGLRNLAYILSNYLNKGSEVESDDSSQTNKLLIELIDDLVYEQYFRSSLSTQLSDVVENNLLGNEKSIQAIQSILTDVQIKKEQLKVGELEYIKDIKKYIQLYSL